jgi:hypothetical protein
VLRGGLLLVFGLVAACTCETYAGRQTYACTETTDCVDPYTCVEGMCVLPSPDGGAGQGGGSAQGGGSTGGGASLGGGTGTDGGGGSGAAVALRFVGAPVSVIRGACSAPIYVDAVDAAQQHTRVAALTQVQIGTTSDNVTFFSDSACTTPLDPLVLTPATDSVRFSFFADMQGTVTLTASGFPLSDATQDETVLPLVRRDTCTLSGSANTVDCTIAPPQTDLTHTALFFQTVSAAQAPDDIEVRCHLASTSTVTCDRAAGSQDTTIAWQTLEPAGGLSVQHVPFTCLNQNSLSVPITSVNPDDTFLLKSASQNGSIVDQSDFVSVRLADATTVSVDMGQGTTCGVNGSMYGELEIVEVAGASVTRGEHGPMTALTEVETMLSSVSLSSTFVMASYRSPEMNGNVCDRFVRPSLPDVGKIAFSRATNSSKCMLMPVEAVSWERVDLGDRAGVQAVDVWMDAGVLTANVNANGVEPERTLLLATAQGIGGCGTGEIQVSDMIAGEATAVLTFDHGTAVITRGAAAGPARFTVQLVQWNP